MINEKVKIGKPEVIELKPEWFRMGYYVYVVLIQYKRKKYYYIGMTGDRKHHTARSPFYRMGGHFSLGKSTQNQIIKGIIKSLKLNVKENPNLLCGIRFTYYTWLVKPFDNKVLPEKHKENRELAERIESGLMRKFKVLFGDEFVFNKHESRKVITGVEKQVEQICKYFVDK